MIATTPTELLGIVRNVPVNFTFGCTIYTDFAVVKYPKPMLILPKAPNGSDRSGFWTEPKEPKPNEN
jgi:hypothetical protein